MAEKFISNWFYAGLGKDADNDTTQRRVDFDGYAENLTKIYNNFDSIGYDVINVVPINMGQSETIESKGRTFLAEVGFSITRGAVVIGKKREN